MVLKFIIKENNVMHKLDQLLIFRNICDDAVIDNFRKFLTAKEVNHKIEHLFLIQYEIINHRYIHSFTWKETILSLILMDENLFSLRCENGLEIRDKLMILATEDVQILRRIYNFDWDNALEELDIKRYTLFSMDKGKYSDNYELHSLFSNDNIGETFIVKELIKYTKANGTGSLSRDYVFKWEEVQGLNAIKEFDKISFHDLIGYDAQINKLKENTSAFITKGSGNNVLLYGQRGTGKSSSIKALLNEYKDQGLRMIEVKKKQFQLIPSIIEVIRNRNYKFILFIDDLSFEEFETDYKHFKAVIEGSFEKRPDNVLIYVTSNRRHLIRETFKEREEDLHSNETVQEKLSLFDRFGITILYDQPKDELYNEMVIKLARRKGITLSDDELLELANEWKVSKSSKSGRAAQQLIDTLN